jgi:hypothetical protein
MKAEITNVLNTAAAVTAVATAGRGAELTGGPAQLRLLPSSATTHPTTGRRGDLFVDKSGRLWFCKGKTNWRQRLSPLLSADLSQ